MQVLAAEKAGSWSDALALYEQALQNEAPDADHPGPNPAAAAARATWGPEAQALPGGDSGLGGGGLTTARRGHLHCLLQMGHLQGMLAQVDGWAVGTAGAISRARASLARSKSRAWWAPALPAADGPPAGQWLRGSMACPRRSMAVWRPCPFTIAGVHEFGDVR